MKILFLAPMPVYQERGSPIAVRMVLEVLSQRGYTVDALVFHEGQDFAFDGMTLRRTPALSFARNIRPGFSWKKLIYDVLLSGMAFRSLLSSRYQLIWAVEEAAFMALVFKVIFRVPYVYDMDSSLAQQMVEKYPALRLLAPILNFFEGLAVRHAEVVVPVCDALAEVCHRHRPQKVTTLYDVPQLQEDGAAVEENLRDTLNIAGTLLMYVGNLEAYQGIDLLLESVALALPQTPDLNLVIVGGEPNAIQHYRQKAASLGLDGQVHLVGPRPVQRLSAYLAQADILVSPRTKGVNTPMKLYSYLASGRAVIATDLKTHTQVLDDTVAVLAPPTPDAFAGALARLAADARLRAQLGERGRQLIAEKYDYTVFLQTLNHLLDWLAQKAGDQPQPQAASTQP